MREFKFFTDNQLYNNVLQYQNQGTYPDDVIDTWHRLSYDEGGAAAVRCWSGGRIAQILSPYDEETVSYEFWWRGYQDTWTNLININETF